VIDIEANHVAVGVKIDVEPFDNFPRLRGGHALQLDRGCPSPDSNAASWLILAKIAVEERVMDRLAVVQCNHPKKSRSSISFGQNSLSSIGLKPRLGPEKRRLLE
jgi:hypothetical protein